MSEQTKKKLSRNVIVVIGSLIIGSIAIGTIEAVDHSVFPPQVGLAIFIPMRKLKN